MRVGTLFPGTTVIPMAIMLTAISEGTDCLRADVIDVEKHAAYTVARI